MKQFLVGVRNATTFLFAWFVLVWMLIYTIWKSQSISVSILWQLFALSFSGAVIFTCIYTINIFKLKKLSPTKKFTIFMAACVLVESILILMFGLFGIKTIAQWGLFISIVIVLYIISLGIFEAYKTQASKKYTKLLKNYQNVTEKTP